MLMIDFDLGSARSEPPAPLFNAAWDWVMAAFRHAGANPVIGTQLGRLLRDAGLTDIDTFGLQPGVDRAAGWWDELLVGWSACLPLLAGQHCM